MGFKGTVIVVKEEDWYVATCLENDVASQGKTIEESIDNLKEAVELYYEDEGSNEFNDVINKQVFVTTLEMAI